MIELRISEQVRAACPQLAVGALACRVFNPATSDELWAEVEAECRRVAGTYRLEDINKRPAIQATRQAYKAFGKDPNRYRPSAEALCRRAVKGLPLYRISALVDIINIVSMRSGFSIGGFDADKIRGGVLELGVGTADDVFEGIGRGMLNIEGLPVWRDAEGGIGTPTSDHERTKLTTGTTRLLMIVNAYNGHDGLPEALDLATDLLCRYAGAEEVRATGNG